MIPLNVFSLGLSTNTSYWFWEKPAVVTTSAQISGSNLFMVTNRLMANVKGGRQKMKQALLKLQEYRKNSEIGF